MPQPNFAQIFAVVTGILSWYSQAVADRRITDDEIQAGVNKALSDLNVDISDVGVQIPLTPGHFEAASEICLQVADYLKQTERTAEGFLSVDEIAELILGSLNMFGVELAIDIPADDE